MVERLHDWLSTHRPDYGKGVALYCLYGNNKQLKQLLLKGETEFTARQLKEELRQLHASALPSTIIASLEKRVETSAMAADRCVNAVKPSANAALIEHCQTAAAKAYKTLMNKRAVLLRLCQVQEWDDVNSPDKIETRGQLALELLQYNQKEVTPAYDTLDYVQEHGQLPPKADAMGGDDTPIDVPDVLVKPTIDNLRKNLNKIKKRPETPERIALISQHEATLNKLLERWASLK
jgi:hypothetical protein